MHDHHKPLGLMFSLQDALMGYKPSECDEKVANLLEFLRANSRSSYSSFRDIIESRVLPYIVVDDMVQNMDVLQQLSYKQLLRIH